MFLDVVSSSQGGESIKGRVPRGFIKFYYYLLFFSKSLNTAIMSATINPPTAVALQENVTLMFSNVKQVSFSVCPHTIAAIFLTSSLLWGGGGDCNIKMGQS